METGSQECKLHYCTLASVLPVGIFHTDIEGHYLSVNEYWCEIAGITAAEAEGNAWVQFLYPDDQERVFAQWYQAVQENLPFRSEYRVQRADGKTTWVLGQAVAEKDKTGAVTGYVGTITDITQYKQTEEELSQYRNHLEELVQERTAELLQANERFHLAAAAVNFTIYDWDIAKKSVYRTEGLIKLLGYRPQETEPTMGWWLDRIHPDDQLRLQPLVSAALAHEETFAFEYRICNKDNEYLYIWDHGLIIRDADGRAVRVVGSMMDITQRKQAEETLRSTQEFLAKLLDYTPAPIYIVTADDQCYRLVNRAWEELVGIPREEAIGYSIEELFPAAVTQQFKEVNQQVIDTGVPVITEEFADVADGRHYFHTVKFPIKDVLGQIEAVAGISLDITERKQAEDALRQNEERFRQMAENIHEVFWMADLELTQMFYVSPAYEAIWGRTCASLYAQPRAFIEAIHPDDRERVLALEQHRQSGFSHEYRIVQPDGSIRWIWEHAFPVRNQAGQLESLVGVSQDISDRKRMEEALRESEQCLRLVLQNMPVMMDALDENWNIIIWNRECEQVTGYSAQEIVNNPKAIELLYPDPDYRQQMIAAWRDRGHDYRNWEWKLTCKDGTVKIISWSNISEQFPIPGWASWGVGVDITDRKQAEEALKQQKELLQTIFDHIPVMVDFYDATGQLKMVNREWERILGWSIDQRPSLDILTELYPDPEYRQFVQDYIVAATGKWGDFKTTVRDGRILDTSWANVRLSDGSCIGIGQDITDRKIAEEALRESEGRFRLLAENSTDMISRHTPEEGIYLYASPACQTLLGYAPEELVGHSAYEFFHPDDLAQIRRGHVTILDLPVTYTVAYRHRCKDGHYIWLEKTCRTIRDQQTGAVREIHSASRDITERKRVEEALRQQVEREQLIARMTRRIHQSLNLEEILNTTVAEVRQFLECDRVIIYRLQSHQSGVVVVESVASGWRRISGTIINDCYFAENYFQLYQQGRIQALEDIDTADLTPCHVDLLARFQVRANLVVPIVQEEELWGLLVAQQCSGTRQWQASEIDLLKSLATQAAIAIQKSEVYAHSQAEIAQRLKAEVSLQQQFLKERLIAQSAQRIRQSLNLEDILNTTVAEVRQFLACDRAIIFRFEPDWSGVVAVESVSEGWTPILGTNIYDHCFEIDYVQPYQEGRIQALEDIYAAGLSPCHLDLLVQFQVRAKLVVPILQGRQLWGLLVAYHCSGPRQWQPFEIDLLKLLSTQVAIAIQQSQLYKQTQHQVQREQALNRVIQTIRNSLDLTTIFSTAVSEIGQLLQADRADIMQYLPERKVWLNVADYHQNPDLLNAVGQEVPDEGNQLAARLKRLEIVRIDDATTCEDEINQDIAENYPGAWLLVPLHFDSSVWGSLSLVRNAKPFLWQDSEIKLACAVADQLAIALQQAELYQQSRSATATALTQAQQLEQALSELQKAQTQLVHSEKMSSLGQLVAGVAHEINNPVTFIYANLDHAENYSEDILGLLKLYQQKYPDATPEIQSEIEAIDLDFLIEDLPKLLSSMKVGAERICEIVGALRNFSRVAEAEMKAVDIHEGLDSTLMILQNRLKAQGKHPEIQVIKEYGNLPKVECYAGQLNQVFMNLLSNAIDALEELHVDKLLAQRPSFSEEVTQVESDAASIATTALSADNPQPSNLQHSTRANLQHSTRANLQHSTRANLQHSTPYIRIRTEVLNDQQVVIRIADNGSGMTEQIQAKLFDPFFTTKPVGTGTGLGLSISYQIVVQKHGGQLHCFSELGQGTEFVIQIPLSQRTLTAPGPL